MGTVRGYVLARAEGEITDAGRDIPVYQDLAFAQALADRANEKRRRVVVVELREVET